ncbi:hypothetical protein NEOLEDRAFT_1081249, partial [Neolentinus lepideus HHB14362 ss-1]
MDLHVNNPQDSTTPVSIDSADYEQRLSSAVAAIRLSRLNSKGQPNLSIREAAKVFLISKSTLSDRYNGKLSRRDAHKNEQKLRPEAEKALVEWIKVM